MSDTDGASVSDHAGSEQDILKLYMSMPIGLCTFDRKLRFDFINEWLAAINGLSVDDHLGRTLSEILPSIAEGVEAQLRGVIETGEPILAGTGTVPSGSLPGGDKCFEYSYSPIKSDDGVVLGVSCVVQDVTERKQAEDALRDSEKRNRAWLEYSPACTKIVDLDFNLQYMSSAGITGLQIDDISPFYGKPYPFDFYPASFRKSMTDNLKKAKETGDVITQEASVNDIEGNALWFHSTLVPVHDNQGQIEYIMIVSIDITERKQAEEALRASEERFRTIYENAPVMIDAFDDSGHCVLWNEQCRKTFGWTLEELNALDDPLEVFYPDPVVRDEKRKSLATKTHGHFKELQYTTKTGKSISTMWATFRLPDGLLFNIGYDITQRKQAEEERRNFEIQIQQTQKLESLGVMAGGIAHDFNNILHAILGNADIALNVMSPEAVGRDSIQEIQIAARRASGLTNQMLAYSRKGALAIEKIDLSVLVQEMAHLLEVTHTKKTILNYRFDEKLPAVKGDPSQLRQVVMNLIANASEAHAEEGGLISVTTAVTEASEEYLASTYAHDELPGGRYVYLEVADTGCGMDEETQRRIFEPFFTTKFTGRRLGMAAVLGIVRAHKGALDIQSEVGRGTTIKVLLPALNERAEPLSVETPHKEEWTGHGTVLVVDDEPQIRKLTKMLLKARGFTVLTAEDGREATKLFRMHHEDIVCVLLDLTMPHKGGEATLVELREISEDVPVVLVSGYSEQELMERSAGLGFSGFLKKPVGNDQLCDMLRAVL